MFGLSKRLDSLVRNATDLSGHPDGQHQNRHSHLSIPDERSSSMKESITPMSSKHPRPDDIFRDQQLLQDIDQCASLNFAVRLSSRPSSRAPNARLRFPYATSFSATRSSKRALSFGSGDQLSEGYGLTRPAGRAYRRGDRKSGREFSSRSLRDATEA